MTEQTLQEVILPETYEGYSIRPIQYTDDDYAQMAALWDMGNHYNGIDANHSIDDVKEEVTDPRFNVETSTRCIFDPEGRMIAQAMVFDTSAIPVRVFMVMDIHTEHRGRGLEHAMMTWAEARARQAIEKCPPEAKVTLELWSFAADKQRIATMEEYGFEKARFFYRMKIHFDDTNPTVPALPEGFHIRAFNYPEELTVYAEARLNSFQDHWGFVVQPIERVIEDLRKWYDNDSKFDSSLCYFVIDSSNGAIAAFSMCRIEEWGEPNQGYVTTLGTTRAYRGKGLALAVLRHSFAGIWERGKRKMTLHVDGASLTGAVRLYEKAGMEIDYIETAYRKTLRDGIDLTTSTLKIES